jgi:hypothetical protein
MYPRPSPNPAYSSGRSRSRSRRNPDVTESGNRLGALSHASRSFHELSRPLMTPDEIATLKKPQKARDGDGKEVITEAGEMVVFVAGENPIKGRRSSTSSTRCSGSAPRSRRRPRARPSIGRKRSGRDDVQPGI